MFMFDSLELMTHLVNFIFNSTSIAAERIHTFELTQILLYYSTTVKRYSTQIVDSSLLLFSAHVAHMVIRKMAQICENSIRESPLLTENGTVKNHAFSANQSQGLFELPGASISGKATGEETARALLAPADLAALSNTSLMRIRKVAKASLLSPPGSRRPSLNVRSESQSSSSKKSTISLLSSEFQPIVTKTSDVSHTSDILYFGYGATLSPTLMKSRYETSDFQTLGLLRNHKWQINSSGFATIVPSDGDVVYGMLYRVTNEIQNNLDEAKIGHGFEKRLVNSAHQ